MKVGTFYILGDIATSVGSRTSHLNIYLNCKHSPGYVDCCSHTSQSTTGAFEIIALKNRTKHEKPTYPQAHTHSTCVLYLGLYMGYCLKKNFHDFQIFDLIVLHQILFLMDLFLMDIVALNFPGLSGASKEGYKEVDVLGNLPLTCHRDIFLKPYVFRKITMILANFAP